MCQKCVFPGAKSKVLLNSIGTNNRLQKNAARKNTTTDSNCHPERSPNPPGEDESRDPENPNNTHAHGNALSPDTVSTPQKYLS
jgi:hypothetical protein